METRPNSDKGSDKGYDKGYEKGYAYKSNEKKSIYTSVLHSHPLKFYRRSTKRDDERSTLSARTMVDVGRLNVRVRVLHQRTKLSRHDCRGTHSSSSTSRRAATANKRSEEDEDLQVNMKINAIRCKLVTKTLNSIREEFTFILLFSEKSQIRKSIIGAVCQTR